MNNVAEEQGFPKFAEATDALVSNLEKLAAEIRSAIEDIARDEVGALEISIWNQEMLCADIKRWVQGIAHSCQNRILHQDLLERSRALWVDAGRYAAAIDQSKTWNGVIQDLCGLYRNAKGAPETGRPSAWKA